MFFPASNIRILLCVEPVDMRKSFDGLSALTRHHLAEDPLSGQLFVFINRRRTYMKVLWFEPGGYCIWSKRLEQGQYARVTESGLSKSVDPIEFKLLIEGLDRRNYVRRKRYQGVASAVRV